MSDAELDALDPLVMNLVVARGIPELRNLDIASLAHIVDEWAGKIESGLRSTENADRNTKLYQHDRDLWRAGGMAVSVAGPSIGVKYTADVLDPGKPEQQFLHGVIDGKQGTCATMPVLYMAIGHRLGWPIKVVVSRDHMWARWDDGRSKGGKRFNLEATSASSDGHEGSFNSVDDAYYAKALETPPIAIESGSDMGSLTGRQTLGVFLQARAGYWAAHGQWDSVERDLLMAASCFPENRDIREFLFKAMARTNPRYFTDEEQARFAAFMGGPNAGSGSAANSARQARQYLRDRALSMDVNEINRRNEEAMRALIPNPSAPTQPWALPGMEQPGTPQP